MKAIVQDLYGPADVLELRRTCPRTAGPTAGWLAEAGRAAPLLASVLVVAAHPDDETFGLGAVIATMAAVGAAVHVLCFTRREASTLNENDADLHRAREEELRRAGRELGVASVTLLDCPDGCLGSVEPGELDAAVRRWTARCHADGLLVFDDTGITGHPDHQAATAAAVRVGAAAGLPVLAWALTEPVAAQLRKETGQPFAGCPADRIDVCVRVDRARQRRAALMHASQISPSAVLWRRLQLQADREHLRWLVPGGS